MTKAATSRERVNGVFLFQTSSKYSFNSVCHAVLHCGHLLGTIRADLALLCVMFTSVFVTFPYGVLGQVWYLIIWIPDCCLLPYFHY